eukprot:780033-Amphidinium_carterae.1
MAFLSHNLVCSSRLEIFRVFSGRQLESTVTFAGACAQSSNTRRREPDKNSHRVACACPDQPKQPDFLPKPLLVKAN